VRIEKIHTGSQAFQAGMRPGDLIVGANRQEVSNLSELKEVAAGHNELLLNVQRGEASFFVVLR
jgi:serine protease Do/serine protease DegQ